MNYDEWNELKKQLNEKKRVPGVKIGKVYWTNVGLNIGYELFGKGPLFRRPVLVLNTFIISGNKAFLGLPLSSKIHEGAYRFIFKDTSGTEQVALLNQIRLFDNKRIIHLSKIKIDEKTLEEIRNKAEKIINPPARTGTPKV